MGGQKEYARGRGNKHEPPKMEEPKKKEDFSKQEFQTHEKKNIHLKNLARQMEELKLEF